ncbi:hypothetical protein M409DRAFT_25218 [Zasmidium cellare ATCC 36951]|uniref:Uncharacterized protein n=1 Tax=Zasmidium cellare ATCC 36951 TaxID=1080233 RepID=A0A6A6CF84_ZASCE|nr:uncharacterized protein M409DRAFT_25218 [Zasmidium cellare ATCC 36951]KAF2164339.1 hypothetical protein M409DRAFT_25218 [Zasmidium cellare ATCC 36951]
MGLIKSGIKWGTIGYVAHQGFKAVGENKQSHQQQQQAPLPRDQPPSYYPQQGQQGQRFQDASGYLHQSWCNGQCGHHCNY